MHIFCKDFKSIMHLIEWRSMFYNDNMKYNTRESIRHKKGTTRKYLLKNEVAVFPSKIAHMYSWHFPTSSHQ